MNTLFTYLVIACMVLFALTAAISAIVKRSWKRFSAELLLLVVFSLVLNLTTGFPSPRDNVAFGGVSPLGALGLMFLCTMLGIVAHYFFYLEEKFSWRSFLKPLFISPIVFLPLVGSVQGAKELEAIQMVSFAILAFQNGFFWKVVLERAEKKIQGQNPAATPVASK